MFQKLLYALGLTLFISCGLYAQSSGTLKGKLVDKDTKDPIPFANIVAELGGKQEGGSTTDFEGNYTIKPIPPGVYDVKVTYVGYKPVMIQGVVVKGTNITFLDIEMESTATTLTTFEVIDYKVPLIEKDGGSSGGTVTSEEITKMAGRAAESVAITVGGVFSKDGEMGSVRGGRENATVMYIDGVRVRGSSSVPKAALEQVSVITGGLPASYGDATSGVVNVTTKGASRVFGAGVELVTSKFLDPYNYNLIGFNVQGPLIKGKDSTSGTSVLGYFLAGELNYQKDNYPFYGGLYKAKDEYLAEVEKNPLRETGLGFGTYYNLQFAKMDNLEKIKSKIEAPAMSANLLLKLDVKTTKNTNLSFGGSLNYNNVISYKTSFLYLNYKEFPQVINNTWRVFGRFTQRFDSDTSSLVKNVFYSIQADYTQINGLSQHQKHKEDLFKYGHVGTFKTYKDKSYELTNLEDEGLYNVYVLNNYYDTLVTFEPSPYNPITANYTRQYYDLYDLHSGYYMNSNLIQNGGALLNGMAPNSIYGMWASPGTIISGYSKSNSHQIGVNINASADVKNHALEFGIQYEQLYDAYIGYAPSSLWYQMRELTNYHIRELDLNNPIKVVDAYGVFQDTVNYNRLYDAGTQSAFDRNLRAALGLAENSTEWIDLDSYDPSMFKIDWFSADELLNNGNFLVSYYGYDHTGKKLKSKPSFDDFFTKKGPDGRYTREIGAFEPIYMAGYILDKFTFKDLIFNIGLRVDRFDANQMVLKDDYLIYEAKTVSEVTNLGAHPTNMPSSAIVYVDDVKNPQNITGYRVGDVWYNAEGNQITDPSLIYTSSGIAPYLVDPNLIKPTSSSFRDYTPQLTYMPRIAFSFPISDVALFTAHYDVTSKRPTDGNRLNPLDYFFINENSADLIANPNLKPEKTIDYELGFQQALNTKSALKLAAYYREMRDLVQVYRFYGAYPVSYMSFKNMDFGTVKGLTVTYDLRRTSNVQMRASYTLQFADGTGSDATSGANLVNTGQPNLRTLNPLDYDRRHGFALSLDYRFKDGKEYNGPKINRKMGDNKVKVIPILQNTGVNFTFTGGSGTPYTKSRRIYSSIVGAGGPELQGMVNGSRLPWSFRIDAKIDRDIYVKVGKKELGMNVYFEILNVLNSKNIMAVYRSTGNPDDDGYLEAAEYQSGIKAQVNEDAYRLFYSLRVNSPYNYSLPRRIRFGVYFNL